MKLTIWCHLLILTDTVYARHHHYHYHHEATTMPSEEKFPRLEDSNERQQFHRNNINSTESYNIYSKHAAGRHVCTTEKTISYPMKRTQTFCKPTYKKYTQRCNNNQLCTGVKLVYETAYREVYSTKSTRYRQYVCCPGWIQITHQSHGCNKPLCSSCQNGGICMHPDTCSCPKGYKGQFCESDIDECEEFKPCDQICVNLPGTYKCDCRESFLLQPDGQSCEKEDDREIAIEGRDLEYELLDKRLHEVELILNNIPEKFLTKEALETVNSQMDLLTSDVKNLKSGMYNVDITQRELHTIKNKLSVLESKANKIDELSKRFDDSKVYSKLFFTKH